MTNPPRAVACIRFVRRLWLHLRPPMEPCMFCGKLTRERNAFDHRIVRHASCREEESRKERLRKDERAKIELIKRAIREVQSETPNAAVIERAASCSPLARHEWQTCQIKDCDECQWLVDWGMVMACDHCGSPGMVDSDGWVMAEPWLSDGACVCIGCSAQIESAFNSANV